MRLMKYLLSLALVVAFSSVYAEGLDGDRQDGSSFDEELNEQDFDSLRNFINTKRAIPLEKKESKLIISGDVRTEWRHLSERGRFGRILGKQRNLRGGEAVNYKDYPVSRNDFDIAFNLYFKYTNERDWAVVQIQFDDSAGVFDNGKECPGQGPNTAQGQISINSDGRLDPDPQGWHGSGRCDDICLKKAYMGYNLYACDETRVDVELGRRRLNNTFDSNVQFLSPFDGILIKYSDSFENVSNWYLNLAGFVVNEKINHLAWAFETGFMNICDSGIDIKYSFIDWQKHGRSQCYYRGKGVDNGKKIWVLNPKGFEFVNSQLTLYYNFAPEVFGVPANINAAFLINHAQSTTTYLKRPGIVNNLPNIGYTRGNIAWYIGFEIGEVIKEGDWSFEAQYQYVGPIAVADGDVRGIGRGNTLNESYTNVRRGNANFKGFKFEFLYALTNSMTIDTIVEWSKAAKNKVGGAHHFSKLGIEAIYAF